MGLDSVVNVGSAVLLAGGALYVIGRRYFGSGKGEENREHYVDNSFIIADFIERQQREEVANLEIREYLERKEREKVDSN